MRYSPEHSEQTRQRVLDAAGREFRQHGYCGVGVDALAESAGVTSGAFYNHFRSKAEAFRAVAVAGVERLRLAVRHFRGQSGSDWFTPFASYYLGAGHRRDIPGGCALPSLSGEVTRAGGATRAEYEAKLLQLAADIAEGLPQAGAPGAGAVGADAGAAARKVERAAAWPLLAELAGGLLLCRAVEDETVANEIASAVLDAVLRHAKAPHGARS